MNIKREEIIEIGDEPPPPSSCSSSTTNGEMTATSSPTPATLPATIDEEDLQILSSKHAAKAKYPPGCPVWYDLKRASLKRLDACHGIVVSVYIDLETGIRVYKVVKTSSSEGEQPFVWQDQLAYAMDCPVLVKGMVDNEPNKELEGIILCLRTARGDRKLSYSVRFLLEGNNRVRVELGVETDQITFRKVETKKESVATSISTNNRETMKVGGHNTTTTGEGSKEKNDTFKKEQSSGSFSDNTVDGANRKHSSAGVQTDSNQKDIMSNEKAKSLLNHTSEDGHNNSSERGAPSSCKIKKSDSTSLPKKSTSLPEVSLREKFEQCNSSPDSKPNEPNENYEQLRLVAVQPNRVSNPLSLLQIVSPKIGYGKTPFVKPPPPAVAETTVPKGGQRPAVSHGRWTPPSSLGNAAQGQKPEGEQQHALEDTSQKQKLEDQQQHDVYCTLTVPLWVTDSANRNIFHHIVGKCDGIERKTGCAVEISRLDPKNKVPMYLTIRPTPSHCQGGRFEGKFDLVKAKELVENSLLDFLQCDDDRGARARLLYELALSLGGASRLQRLENGVLQQRRGHSISNDSVVWMNVLDLSTTLSKSDLLSFNEEVQQKIQHVVSKCSVEVFGHGLTNRKPFVLICGKSSESVGEATKLVSNAINDYPRRSQNQNEMKAYSDLAQNNALVSKPRVSLGKRKIPSEDASSSLSSHSHDRGFIEHPTKAFKVGGENMKKNTRFLKKSRKAECVLTVPLWILKKCDRDQDKKLFRHLAGKHKGILGHKQKEISSRTNCTINFTHCSSRDCVPMEITIKSKYSSFDDVERGIRMITESLFEFMDDESSVGRLIWELAITAEGTYEFYQSEGAVQQECPNSHCLVWMTLLELPSAKSKGKLTPHGKFLDLGGVQQGIKGDTNCSVEVYCSGHSIPILSGPYVLVCGNDPKEVNEVAARVADKIEIHQQGCSYHCQFF
eukprot:CAMPEP_0201920362 /NCGR_PEP_ID=MMETSP0903-20130614/8986_1 /ASSEMBLY_ACC=CAM_ASM_000552 /TAXON_ID=420261 /ORGANISM="Thalassiosira antarctica, Strain CCMP982" /LENGTH=954 /DNA_ID=CAMNT_0048457085 /DNA_START=96 /DNA_END=2963 /DNA_ORIENTATION=-